VSVQCQEEEQDRGEEVKCLVLNPSGA
jgi:hypothetical protein